MYSAILKCASVVAIAFASMSLTSTYQKLAESGGWEIQKTEKRCELRSTQDAYTLSYEYEAGNAYRMNSLRLYNDGWRFKDAQTGRFKILLRHAGGQTVTIVAPFEAAYEENYIWIGNVEQAQLTQVAMLAYYAEAGSPRTGLVIDFKDSPDIKFDLTGASELAGKYIDCMKSIDPRMR